MHNIAIEKCVNHSRPPQSLAIDQATKKLTGVVPPPADGLIPAVRLRSKTSFESVDDAYITPLAKFRRLHLHHKALLRLPGFLGAIYVIKHF